MNENMTIFDCLDNHYKINKNHKIKIIELFAGYGTQHLGMKYLNLEKYGYSFESHKISEWTIKSIQAYKDLHYKDRNIDFSKDKFDEEILEWLEGRISKNYSEPLPLDKIKKEDFRKIYNNMMNTNNLGSICKIKGKDLEIVDTKHNDYILFYSYPCQDLSVAGKLKGQKKGSGTRSALLFEVGRLLKEVEELPQILILENVPNCHGEGNVKEFNEWQEDLRNLGYTNYWQDLSGTQFGIPQSRNRCFMVSIMGNYSYSFPHTISLQLKLKDLLEKNIEENLYLSEKQINLSLNWKAQQNPYDSLGREICPTLTTRSGAFAAGMILTTNKSYKEELLLKKQIIDCKGNLEKDCLHIKETTKMAKDERNMKEKLCDSIIESGIVKEGDIINHSYTNNLTGKNPNSRQTLYDYIESDDGISPTLTTRPDTLGVVVKTEKKDILYTNNLRIRKLSCKECFRLMGVKDEDYDKMLVNQSKASMYHLAGDSLITTIIMALVSQFLDIDWAKEYEPSTWWNIEKK